MRRAHNGRTPIAEGDLRVRVSQLACGHRPRRACAGFVRTHPVVTTQGAPFRPMPG